MGNHDSDNHPTNYPFRDAQQSQVHHVLLQAHRGENSTTVPETTRLHDYDATSNIKDGGNTVHASLRSVAKDLAVI